ncbi:hypothetical protein J3454_01065 [Erythrobacter sp. NFXS35]|uniref:hypothetical protein n=1 Tax=Erythrobacter sp. NFXS35 TaxID=2818436 RepID=UPI0032DEB291
MFVGGIGDFLLLIVILAGLGVVFIFGTVIALFFFKIVGMGSGRAVVWGYGLPLCGSLALVGIGWLVKGDEPARELPVEIPLRMESDLREPAR